MGKSPTRHGEFVLDLHGKGRPISVPISKLTGTLHVRVVSAYGSPPSITFWAWIEDDGGNRAAVCIDGREGSATRYRLFDQARHPKKDEATAKLVALGSPEEDLVIGLLSNWYDSKECLQDMTEYGKELLQDSLLRLRLCDPDDFPQEAPADEH